MANGLPPEEWKFTGPTESAQFTDLLRSMGVPYSVKFLKQGDCGVALIDAGFNLTAVGCIAISVGSREFIFSQGPAFYFGDRGYGPAGALLLQHDNETGHYIPRTLYVESAQEGFDETCSGIAALKASYPNAGWPT